MLSRLAFLSTYFKIGPNTFNTSSFYNTHSERNGDDAVVRRSGEEDDDNDDGEINSGVFIISSNGGADSVRKRGQEDEEGEEVQGVVREREAQEGEED